MSNTKKGAAGAAPTQDTIIAELEAKLEVLIAENELLKAADTDAKAENDKLKAALEAAKYENEKLKAALQVAEKEVESAAEYVAELKDQLDNSDSKDKGPVVTIGKEKYRVAKGIRTKDGVLLPVDIASNKKLLASLVEKNSTIIVKL